MEFWDRYLFLRHMAAALAQGVFVAVVLPIFSLLIFGYPLLSTRARIGSGAGPRSIGAAPVGIALGLSPLFVFFVLVCTGMGIFIGLFDIFDAVGHTWPPAADFLARTTHLFGPNSPAERYGILGSVPCEIIIGVYANAPRSWVLGWHKDRSVLSSPSPGIFPASFITILDNDRSAGEGPSRDWCIHDIPKLRNRVRASRPSRTPRTGRFAGITPGSHCSGCRCGLPERETVRRPQVCSKFF